jgi:hypothetical protein
VDVGYLIATAKEFEEKSKFVSQSARNKYHVALQELEKRWAAFSSSEDGNMNGDALVPFINEVAEFMKARNVYCNNDKRLSPGVRF